MSDKETEIRERLEKAAKCEWIIPPDEDQWDDDSPEALKQCIRIASGRFDIAYVALRNPNGMKAIVDLIAHAPTDIRYLLDENARLRAELAERDKDAERYRWLHSENQSVVGNFKVSQMRGPWLEPVEDLDAAIDAAMAEDKTR